MSSTRWIPSLVERVSRIAPEENRRPEVLLQVKLRPDPSKVGLSADELGAIWSDLQALPGLRISGLMTMAPLDMAAEQRKALFSECRALADQLALAECSMGMSTDWKEAAEAGSTWLRIGSALFGRDWCQQTLRTSRRKENGIQGHGFRTTFRPRGPKVSLISRLRAVVAGDDYLDGEWMILPTTTSKTTRISAPAG